MNANCTVLNDRLIVRVDLAGTISLQPRMPDDYYPITKEILDDHSTISIRSVTTFIEFPHSDSGWRKKEHGSIMINECMVVCLALCSV